MKSIYTYFILILAFLSWSISLIGQSTNDLNQKVTIEAENVTISEILLNIGSQAHIKFSYNPKLIKSTKRVSLTAQRKPIREILDELFVQKFEYKLRGNYVIIAEKPKVEAQPSKTRLSGFIIDKETKEGIENVSVFTSSGKSTVTDATGAFTIELKKKENSQIELRKKGFKDFVFDSQHNSRTALEIPLEAVKSFSLQLHRDSMTAQRLDAPNMSVATMYKINTSLKVNQENIQDEIKKPVSLSLYPGIATYGNLSGNIQFNAALNFIGYNRGINGVELSIFSGINRDDVKGFQLAGLSNYVGKDMTGFQASGIFNKVGGDLRGLQMSGISNFNFADVHGAQFSGIINHAKGDVYGLQYAIIVNNANDVRGVQYTGIFNRCDTITGLQGAGINNHANHVKGVQAAGIYNYANTVKGVQFSGIVNIAKKVNGSQIGFINVVDSIAGIPIGLINISKNGYMRLGMYTDELIPVNIEFRSGVDRFYTILSGGVQTDIGDNDNAFYTYGGGFGSRINLGSRLALEIDATGHHLTKREFSDNLSLLIRGHLGIEYTIADHIALSAGASYTSFLFDRELLGDEDFNKLRENYIVDTSDSNNDHIWRSWIGYKAGIRYAF